jgi:hypothetical protein
VTFHIFATVRAKASMDVEVQFARIDKLESLLVGCSSHAVSKGSENPMYVEDIKIGKVCKIHVYVKG